MEEMRKRKTVLEACVDSVESAMAAAAGGATRLELCANLIIGGTTPSLSLFRQVKRETDLPVHVLIRPRFGDFLYTEREFDAMLEEIRYFVGEGADAVVTGVLCADGSLDRTRMAAAVDSPVKSAGSPGTVATISLFSITETVEVSSLTQ